MMRKLLGIVALVLLCGAARATTFCDDVRARYSSGTEGPTSNVLRCWDFTGSNDASANDASVGGVSTRLWDAAVSAENDGTGSLHWKIKSYDQVLSENSGWTHGHAYRVAFDSMTPSAWQRWIGLQQLTPGQDYWIQFKFKFNKAWKVRWGGGGQKTFGLDAGCRQWHGTWIPTACGSAQEWNPANGNILPTASSMENLTMTINTNNLSPASDGPNAYNRLYPTIYQGSSNFGSFSQGFAPLIPTPSGTGQMNQPGPDSGWEWNPTTQQMTGACDTYLTLSSPVGYGGPDAVFPNGGPTAPCVTYGLAYDECPAGVTCSNGENSIWHQITVRLRPSGHFYNTEKYVGVTPANTTQCATDAAYRLANDKCLRHDTLLKVWYDGMLIANFDPDEPKFRSDQVSAEVCAANQDGSDGQGITDPHPNYTYCHTGIDLFKNSTDKPPVSTWCVYSCAVDDPGADLTQVLLWTFSYRRGRPPTSAWCDSEIGAGDQPYYSQCLGAVTDGGDDQPGFDAFLHHSEVNVYYDDLVVSKIPLPMQMRPPAVVRVTASDPHRAFGLDARDLDAAPPNTFTRLFPGPDKTFYNTGYGILPASDINAMNDGNGVPMDTPATLTHGASTLSSTNYAQEIPVSIPVPLGGGFVATIWGNSKMLYFGGGHSGYMANRVNVFDLATGRWSQSGTKRTNHAFVTYVPDMGTHLTAAIGLRTPTPPGVGCKASPFTKITDPQGQQTYFLTTGNTQSGSPVVTNIASEAHMCPINGLCPTDNSYVGGYAITGPGIPADTIIKTVDSATQITMTRNATATAVGVTLEGGRPTCGGYAWNLDTHQWQVVAGSGGNPNTHAYDANGNIIATGSPGGRGWWEHMDDRYAWDPRANGWLMVQNSGTWLYEDEAQTWQRLSGEWPVGNSLMCGSGDYTKMGMRFATTLNTMLLWCNTDAIFQFNYGTGAPNFTGAGWVQIHQVPDCQDANGDATSCVNPGARQIRNSNTDVNSQSAWDPVHGVFYQLTIRSTPYFGLGDNTKWNPYITWFNPSAGSNPCSSTTPPVGTTPPPCGKSSRLDETKTNYPQGWSTTRNSITQANDESQCWFEVCQQVTGSIVSDAAGNLYIVGRRGALGPYLGSGDAQILVWKLSDPLGPSEAWTKLDTFNFNTNDYLGLPIWSDQNSASDRSGHPFALIGSNFGLLTYVPERDAFYLITRDGSGDGGSSTRGTGDWTVGGCWLQYAASSYVQDDCFRMYAWKIDGTFIPPEPSGDTTSPVVAFTEPQAGATVNGTVTLTATASDNVGVTHVEFYVNGSLVDNEASAPYSYDWNSAAFTGQNVTLMAKAYDEAGNSSTASRGVYVATNVVTNPPKLALSNIVFGSSQVAGTVMSTDVDASASASIQKVELFLNSTLVATKYAPPYDFSWDSTPYAKHVVEVVARVTDVNGRSAQTGGTVYILPPADVANPSVSITAPISSANVRGTQVTTDVLASDAHGIAKVELYLNGSLVDTKTKGPWRFTWSTDAYANTDVTITAKAYDPSGRSSTSSGVVVHALPLDATPPSVAITTPNNSATVYGVVPTTVTASDAVGVTKVELYLNGSLHNTRKTSPYTFAWDSGPFVGGSVTVLAKAYDVAGNNAQSSVSVSAVAIPDTTPPTLTVSTPSFGSTVNAGSVSINTTASDSQGIARVELYVNGVLSDTKYVSPYNFTWNSSAYTKTTVALSVKAYDNATPSNVTVKSGTVRVAAVDEPTRMAQVISLDVRRKQRKPQPRSVRRRAA